MGTVQASRIHAVSIMLHRVVSALDRGGDRILRAELGISHSRAVLLLVVDRQGPLSQSDLAAQLGSTEPAVTGLLREVRKDGFVEVTPDPGNRRVKLVSLTPQGEALVQEAGVRLQERLSMLLERADVDPDQLLQMLTRIAASMGLEEGR